ncbi:MAG: hypothetical protein KAV87_32425, partial [Desulfobacteraceae bacterium]|nr:hypothetical protein [Desulfobacteraceae bacterium]
GKADRSRCRGEGSERRQIGGGLEVREGGTSGQGGQAFRKQLCPPLEHERLLTMVHANTFNDTNALD